MVTEEDEIRWGVQHGYDWSKQKQRSLVEGVECWSQIMILIMHIPLPVVAVGETCQIGSIL